MGTIIERLATWARDLSYDDLPRSVRERARLQHLSAAGAIKAVADRPLADQLRRGSATPSPSTSPAAERQVRVRLNSQRLPTLLWH